MGSESKDAQKWLGGGRWKIVWRKSGWRSNEMEGRCESDGERDEVYLTTLGDEEKTGLQLDGWWMINLIDQLATMDVSGVILAQKSEKKCSQNECSVRSSLWHPLAHTTYCRVELGCANFFNGGPNSIKHNVVRAARLNRIIFYQLLILRGIMVKPHFAKLLYIDWSN